MSHTKVKQIYVLEDMTDIGLTKDSKSAVMRMLKKKKKTTRGNHSIRTNWQYRNDVLSNRDK